MTEEEYVNITIGKPWVNRAEGPCSFDCWGIVIDSFRKLDNIDLPQIDGYCDKLCDTGKAAQEAFDSDNYIKCQPANGAIMTAFFNDKLVHVGRCLAGGVLHATEGIGVRHDKYQVIARVNQRVEYYKYVNNSSPQRSIEHNKAR